jgi:4-alpha-glucanotransferase
MTAWALPAMAGIAYEDLVADLKAGGRFEKFRPFLRGGIWENFLVKYPESNLMHKKMLAVSARVHRSAGGSPIPPPPPVRDLWRGQCNNAYWHGLFGGLYSRHLRRAVYKNLISAETAAEAGGKKKGPVLSYEILDLDKDLQSEIRMVSPSFAAVVKPGYGGALIEIDWRPGAVNLADTLARRPEPYHRRLKIDAERAPAEGDPSAQPAAPRTDPAFADTLMYDWYNRHSFLDHFLGEEATFEQFRRCQYPELGNFLNQPYEFLGIQEADKPRQLAVRLRRRGGLWRREGKIATEVAKRFLFRGEGAAIEAEYDIFNRSAAECRYWFGAELCLALPGPETGLPALVLPGNREDFPVPDSGGVIPATESLTLRDGSSGFAVSLEASPAAEVWHFPLETFSRSESGPEKSVQGNVLLFSWRFPLRPGEKKKISLRLSAEGMG